MSESSQPDTQDPSAPPGAACASHPEREAHFTCPRCGSYACVFCWHPSLQRCDACLKRDPAAAAPPIPWEHPELGWTTRYLRTLATALSPARSAPSFARSELHPALTFLLLSSLPLSLLAGIVPHTRTLLFQGSLQVTVLGGASGAEVALDVLRAMAGQLWLDGVQLLSFLFPYVSLIRAYAGPDRAPFALRVLLYRAWLHPFALLVFYVLLSLLPQDGEPGTMPVPAVLVLSAVQLAAPVLFMMATTYVARLACGLGMAWSILIVTVSVTVSAFFAWAANLGLSAVLPAMP